MHFMTQWLAYEHLSWRRCVVLNPLVSEENWDQFFPDNQLVAFSKYLTKQMASMCVCEGESNGGGAMMLDFVKECHH